MEAARKRAPKKAGRSEKRRRFDQLTHRFDIHISRATHPVKSTAIPPGRSVNRHYPIHRFLSLTLTPAVIQVGQAPPFHLLPQRHFDHAVQSHIQPQP
ncbi:hypothetical protein E2C01_022654 [Portunus trituberculatus]|uniref:Uncharacterized protein n=1 Tax=Portunus trituberculatus TaxID=210409 RepID=A0A5B7E8H7_PORTR|nr:hypothetical protein [Portunus trituberculatus]